MKNMAFEISIPDAWIGKTVGELDIRKKYNVNIMALRCNGVLDMNIASETLLGDEPDHAGTGKY